MISKLSQLPSCLLKKNVLNFYPLEKDVDGDSTYGNVLLKRTGEGVSPGKGNGMEHHS